MLSTLHAVDRLSGVDGMTALLTTLSADQLRLAIARLSVFAVAREWPLAIWLQNVLATELAKRKE